MNDQPLVSVLTPSFRQATWLGDNLRSVAVQTYANVEHIVMDGGSDDGSVAILERMSRPGLQWSTEPDRGQSHALNKALAASHGEIVGWLNSDDAYFEPSVVEGAVDLFRRRPDVVVVYGHAALVNAEGLLLHLLWSPPFSRRLLRLHDFIPQPAAFIRRAALGDHLADESFDFTMDYELWLRLSAAAPFARMNRIVAIDRHQPLRKSTRMTETMHADLKRLEERYGIDSGARAGVARRLWKVVDRFIGASLIPAAIRQPLAYRGHHDGSAAVLRRQIATPRSAMPVGRAHAVDVDRTGAD